MAVALLRNASTFACAGRHLDLRRRLLGGHGPRSGALQGAVARPAPYEAVMHVFEAMIGTADRADRSGWQRRRSPLEAHRSWAIVPPASTRTATRAVCPTMKTATRDPRRPLRSAPRSWRCNDTLRDGDGRRPKNIKPISYYPSGPAYNLMVFRHRDFHAAIHFAARRHRRGRRTCASSSRQRTHPAPESVHGPRRSGTSQVPERLRFLRGRAFLKGAGRVVCGERIVGID